MMSWVAWCSPQLKRFVPVDAPTRRRRRHRGRLEERGVGAVVRLGEPEGEAAACRRGSRASTRPAARRCRSRASSAPSGSCRRSSSRSAGRCAARGPCGEVLTDDRHLEVGGVAAAELGGQGAGGASRRASARRRISRSSSSHSWRGTPPFSKSVRAHSRRWSKNRTLSSAACNGTISRSMNSSRASRVAWMSLGIAKLTVVSPCCRGRRRSAGAARRPRRARRPSPAAGRPPRCRARARRWRRAAGRWW